MASSQPDSRSVKKGQVAIFCQLCETDPKLKWKCLECDFLMCERCKDIVHSKFGFSQDHNIIDIKEIGKHEKVHKQNSKPDFTRIECGIHTGQNCCLYCKNCESLVCQICVSTESHNKHRFREISLEYEVRVKKIKDKLNEGEGIQRELQFHEQKLHQIKSNQQINYEKVKQEILDDEKALMDDIKKETKMLIEELDLKRDKVSNSIDSTTKQLKEEQSQIQEQQGKVYELLHVNNFREVFSDLNLTFKKVDMVPFKRLNEGVSKFIQGDKSKIKPILGRVEESDLNVKSRFKTRFHAIFSVECCPNGSLWIGEIRSGIQKVKPEIDNLKVLTDINIDLYDAALFSSGDVLFSVFGLSELQLIPSGSSEIRSTLYKVSPLQLTGVHITKGNKIIVGARDKQSDFPVKGQRKVVVFDIGGDVENVIEYDKFNQPLFSRPYRITSNSKGDISIVDIVSIDCRGRVVVVDQGGEIKNIYTGHPEVNTRGNPFNPTDITTTPADNFVVADRDNHTLHILDNKGRIITYYNRKEMGIKLPRSLSFTSTGRLYIGCSNYEFSAKKAKLFELDNVVL